MSKEPEVTKPIIYDGSTPIDWNKIGPHHRIKFIIPVSGISRKKWWQFWKKDDDSAKEELSKLIANYKKEIKLDDSTGEITYNKNEDYFLPVNDDDVDLTIIIDKNKK